MEAFAEDYITHNRPLILLSGIGDEGSTSSEQPEPPTSPLQAGGFRIRTNTSPLTDPLAQTLLQVFMSFNSASEEITARNTSVKDSPLAFKIQRVGRAYALPPRKASPPPHAPRLGPFSDDDSPPPPLTLHSTISPLTPTSPLYADGIFTPLWITKHQRRLPAVFITFFSLTADPDTSSLYDNQIKSEIGAIRSLFSSTNYKTKVVVVLVGASEGRLHIDWDERIANIRRGTSLDSRQVFFLAAEQPKAAVHDFVSGILNLLQPFCLEYYRDLSKHTRRKRNRAHIPPPTSPPTSGTSRTLSSQGWNVRYEFKLGIFAEFRQEMDAACRNYESAHDCLFGPELFDTISSWSPRFNEARTLADAIAIRTLRCLLWTAQPTAAARFWTKHRDWTKNLVDRQGKGSANYGWEAWQAIWYRAFAQLLASASNLELARSGQESSMIRQYSPPEKSIPAGSRMAPWDLLHHDGYWWNQSWKRSQGRRDLAYQIPEEDRTAPGRSPASAIANRAHLYDAYLALEPHLEHPVGDLKGFDHSAEILSTIHSTVLSFSDNHQTRFAEGLLLEQAKEHLRRRCWHEATATIRSIWPCLSWREAGWWRMVSEAAWTFRQAARHAGDGESLLRLEWEAQNSAIAMTPEWALDFHRALEEIESPPTPLSAVVNSEDSLSPIWASFHFAHPEGNVGEPLRTQLALMSIANRRSQVIHLSEVEVIFSGPLRPIRLLPSDKQVDSDQTASILLSQLTFDESSPTAADDVLNPRQGSAAFLDATTNISIPPGQAKVFDLDCIPREAGEIRVAAIKLRCKTSVFSLTYSINHQISSDARWWSLNGTRPQSRQLVADNDATVVRILPKPPKVRILLPNKREMYFTNEHISLVVLVRNDEVETADVSLEANLLSPRMNAVKIRWDDTEESETPRPHNDGQLLPTSRGLLGSVQSTEHRSLKLLIDQTSDVMQHQLEVKAQYHLLSDPETRISKTIVAEVRLSLPLEATYELLPRLNRSPWPSFFDPLNIGAALSQHFLLVSKISSLVAPSMIIDSVSANTHNVWGDAVYQLGEEQVVNPELPLSNRGRDDGRSVRDISRTSSFDLVVRKNVFGDVRSVTAEIDLLVRWRREPGGALVTSPLVVPRYMIPMAEPRVLLYRQDAGSTDQAGLVRLHYTIENPSMHYLTFNLAMESSDEFAFSGPKAITFSLVPASRHTVHYRILVYQQEKWVRVSLGVTDAYFSKSLRIHAAGDGVKSDGKRGLWVWAG